MAARGLENHKELISSDGILDVEQLPIRPTQETTSAVLGKLCSRKNYKHNAPPIKKCGRGYFCILFYFKCDLNLSQKTLLSSTAHLTSFSKLLTTQKLRLDLEVAHKEKNLSYCSSPPWQKEGPCQSAQHCQKY